MSHGEGELGREGGKVSGGEREGDLLTSFRRACVIIKTHIDSQLWDRDIKYSLTFICCTDDN